MNRDKKLYGRWKARQYGRPNRGFVSDVQSRKETERKRRMERAYERTRKYNGGT